MDPVTRALFTALQPHLRGLGDDVIELATEASVTYRVYDFFVEVIPRRHRLTLVVNLAYEDCQDPMDNVRDATKSAFVINATETGGILYELRDKDDIPAAIAIVRQAYESIAE